MNEGSSGQRQKATTGKVWRFKEFIDGAASWSRVERIIARLEIGDEGGDTHQPRR